MKKNIMMICFLIVILIGSIIVYINIQPKNIYKIQNEYSSSLSVKTTNEYKNYKSAKGEDFRKKKIELLKEKNGLITTDKEYRLFFGDSITFGSNVEEKKFDSLTNVNFGIPADDSFDMYRTLNQTLFTIPRKNISQVYIFMGTNDTVLYSQGLKTSDTSKNINDTIKVINDYAPKAQINVISTLPVNSGGAIRSNLDEKQKSVIETNEAIKNNLSKNATYIDVYDKFLDTDQKMKREYTTDGLHLSDQGYQKLFEELKPYLKKNVK
ncbi:MAG: GDSL-type esterase/lipase family protein [Mycoplasmatales bacterium]